MNLSEHDIQAIVGEVVRRIQSLCITQHAAVPANQLELTDRLVTLASIKGKLHNIEQVVVPAKAIISPAVHDELKQRKIQLVSGTTTSTSTTTQTKPPVATLLAANIASDYNRAVLARLVGSYGATIEQASESELASLVARQAAQVASGSKAIWFTSQSAKAVCLANRHSQLWAIEGHNAEQLPATLKTLPANILVIDPRKKSRFVLQSMVKCFVEE